MKMVLIVCRCHVHDFADFFFFFFFFGEANTHLPLVLPLISNLQIKIQKYKGKLEKR